MKSIILKNKKKLEKTTNEHERMDSQRKMCEEWLLKGNTITPLEALNMFGSLRLSSIIFDLRKKYIIKTEMIKIKNKRIARYSLISKIDNYENKIK